MTPGRPAGKPIKVLMFGWEFPPHNSGGLGVACSYLAKALAQQNVEITFVLPKRLDVSANELRLLFADIPNIKPKSVDSLLYPYVTSSAYSALRDDFPDELYGEGLFEEVRRYAHRAYQIAQEEEFDIIHAHDWLAFPAGLAAKRATGKPLVVHVHATEFDRSGDNINRRVYEIEKQGMENADSVVAVSNYTKGILTWHYGIPPEKICVAHNAIGKEEYGGITGHDILCLKDAGAHVVLFVGRLTMQKGPDYFLRAAKRVLEYLPNTYFIIAGSGDMERQIINEAAYMGIGDKVLFAGFVRGKRLQELYSASDLYVLSSISEPFGITPLESVANGTPVLISRQSGVSEVLKNALKADFWDIDEMANKIVSVLSHQPLKKELQDMGFKEIANLTWQKTAETCISVYENMLQKFAAKSS